MKNLFKNFPSLGTIHASGYWLSIVILLFGGGLYFLYYLLLITVAVPVAGAFQRTPKLPWRIFALTSVAGGIGFQVFQYNKLGNAGLMFHYVSPTYPAIGFNGLSLLAILLIMLPLSALCGIDQIRNYRRANPLPIDKREKT